MTSSFPSSTTSPNSSPAAESTPPLYAAPLLARQLILATASKRSNNSADSARAMGAFLQNALDLNLMEIPIGRGRWQHFIRSIAPQHACLIITTCGRLMHAYTNPFLDPIWDLLTDSRVPILVCGPLAKVPCSVNATGPLVYATSFSDASESALPYVAALASSLHSPVQIVHVLPSVIQPQEGTPVASTVIHQALIHVAERVHAGSTVSVLFGRDIATTLAIHAGEVETAMLILGINPGTLLRAGSRCPIVTDLLSTSPCPVLLVPCRPQPAAYS